MGTDGGERDGGPILLFVLLLLLLAEKPGSGGHFQRWDLVGFGGIYRVTGE